MEPDQINQVTTLANDFTLNGVDYGIISVIGISVLIGLIRGFVREAISLVTWIIALVLGILYCEQVSEWFHSISMVGIRLLLAFVLIVLSTLIVGGILNYLIGKLINVTKFSVTDRIVGLLFGGARGVVIIALAVLLLGPTSITQNALWHESAFILHFEPIAGWMKNMLPEDFMKRMQ